MRDKVAHMGVINRALCFGFPCGKSASVIGVHSHDMDLIDVFENILLRADKLAAKDKVKALGHGRGIPVFQRGQGSGSRRRVKLKQLVDRGAEAKSSTNSSDRHYRVGLVKPIVAWEATRRHPAG